MLRLAHHGLAAADGTLRINQVRGAEAGAALLALVAVSEMCIRDRSSSAATRRAKCGASL